MFFSAINYDLTFDVPFMDNLSYIDCLLKRSLQIGLSVGNSIRMYV